MASISESDIRSFQIVVGLDMSEYAPIVLEKALDQAARHDAPIIHALTIWEDEPVVETKARFAQLVTNALDAFGHGEGQLGRWRVCLHGRKGLPDEEICLLAAEVEADLIVVGRFGLHGAKRRASQSVAERVLRGAICPTLVVQLTDHAQRPDEQCPACVVVRRESAGEHWFCHEHVATNVSSLNASRLLPHEGWGMHGGLMW